MAILDALGLKAVGLKRRLILPSLITWLFSKNRAEHRPIGYFGFFVGCAALIYTSYLDTPAIQVFESIALDVLTPVVSVLQKPIHFAQEITANFRAREDFQSEITRLRQQNDNLLLTNAALKQNLFVAQDATQKTNFVEHLAEGQILQKQYQVATTLNQPIIGQPLLVAITSENNVEKNDIVMGSRGLLGRITQVGYRSARIATLFDTSSKIPVEVSGVQAIASGNGTENLELTHIKDAQCNLKAGDVVVTSGFGGIYPKGIPVGIIASVDNKEIFIQPFEATDLAHHTVVIVKAAPSINEEFGIEP